MNGLLLLLLFLSYQIVDGNSNHTLSFMFITSFGKFGLNSSGVIPAAEMAITDINDRSTLLPGYVLGYDSVRDSQCQYDKSLDAFFQGIQSAPVKLAVIECGCSVATEPVAAISHHWNISQIAYFSGSADLSDRNRYKRFFRDIPSNALDPPAFVSVLQHFGWKRMFSITQDEALFTGANANLLTAFNQVFDNVLLTSDDYRIFYLNCYSGPARKIICEASKRGYMYPKYAWILPDWYIDQWWMAAVDGGSVNCTDTELETFLERTLILQRYLSPDANTALTDAGIESATPQQFQEQYKYLAKQSGYDLTDAGARLYDAIWILAVALNRTAIMVNKGNINGTGCENISGSLVPLEQFQYSNEKMGCLIQYNIQMTNFSGVSGNIQFDSNGTCIQHTLRLKQYRRNGSLTKTQCAHFSTLDSYVFNFELGFSDQIVYPDGTPPDGTPMQVTVSLAIPLDAVMYILAACGITFAGACLVFNILFRQRRVVKLSSPNLNYLIILGAVLMYISVYIYIRPVKDSSGIRGSCVLREWLFVVGYALCFGSVLAKMWRIYYIIQNPTAKKIVFKDWQMIAVALCISAVGVVLLILGTAVPQLRGQVTLRTNDENPNGIAQLGLKEEYFIWTCYGSSTPPFYWRILIFSYLVILQIIGIMLAFQTRKVKFPGLNDSVFVAAIIYTSSIVLVILIVDTFILNNYINTFGAIFTVGIIILTTVFLAFTFVPKMYLLYKDPEGKSISSNVNMPETRDPLNQDTRRPTQDAILLDSNQLQIIKELRLENSLLKEKLMTSSEPSVQFPDSKAPQLKEFST
ncbi:hypothetical protein EMCRGX_G029359 [Ephydatia muelleri]